MGKTRIVKCSKCKGLGFKGNDICSYCDGDGYIEKEKSKRNIDDRYIKPKVR